MRGGTFLLIGMVCIVISFCAGSLIQQSAMDAMRNGGHREVIEKMQGLQPFAAITNLIFYGGGIAIIVGIVLLIVQSQQPVQTTSAPDAQNVNETNLEAENRRLREELDRLKQNDSGDTA